MPLVVEPCRHCGKQYKTRKADVKPNSLWRGSWQSYNDCENEQQDFCPCQAHQPGDKGYTPRNTYHNATAKPYTQLSLF